MKPCITDKNRAQETLARKGGASPASIIAATHSNLLRLGARAALGAVVGLTATALAQTSPTITPVESSVAFKNPYKGFRMWKDTWKSSPAMSSLSHHYIPYNQLENNINDTQSKIQTYWNTISANYASYNVRVVPRVHLDWYKPDSGPDQDGFFPADLKTGTYANATDEQLWDHPNLKSRVERIIGRLGNVWDKDPRVAWIQSGMIGWWGEQEQPGNGNAVNGGWITPMGNAFTTAFTNKKVLVRNREQWLSYNMGAYWDSFGHPNQPNVNTAIRTHNYDSNQTYKNNVIEGETAYNWTNDQPGQSGYGTTDFQVKYGANPMLTFANRKPVSNGGTFTGDEAYKNYNYVPETTKNFTNNMIDVIRDLHCSTLGWISEWTLDPVELVKWSTTAAEVKASTDRMHNAFGYHFVITSFSCTSNPSAGGDLTVNFSVQNKGSAPFLENWPVAVVLVDPSTKLIKWKATLPDVNIKNWLPGTNYNFTTRAYDNAPSGGSGITKTVTLPPSLTNGEYLIGLSILDPTSGRPGVFFAANNFLKQSQTQPLGRIRVGSGTIPTFNVTGNVTFNSLVNDDQRFYNLPLSRTGWTASASHSQNGEPASNAIDGSAITRWSTGQDQSSTGNQWFMVNLGGIKKFDRIALDTSASVGDNPRAYVVEVSSDSSTWSQVATGADGGPQTFVSFASQNAQWVRVKQTGSATGKWWSIHEFNVYAPTAARKYIGSSSNPYNSTDGAFDGVASSRWDTGAYQKPGQWFQADLLSIKSFSKVVLDSAGSSSDYPQGYTVQVSNDQVTWTQVASGSGSTVTTGGVTTIPVGSRNARFVRVNQTGTSTTAYWSIHEFSVTP